MAKLLKGFIALTAVLAFAATVSAAGNPSNKDRDAVSKAGSVQKSRETGGKSTAVKGGVPAKAVAKAPSKAKADGKVAAKAPSKAKADGKVAAKAPSGKKKGKGAKVAKAVPLPPSDWSPNGFPVGRRGWCTWYVDGRFSEFFGERLEFSPRYGSNAVTWYDRVQKVARPSEAAPGDIMVMRRGKKDRRGHVAFVEDVIPGVGWLISHANFDFRGHEPVKTEVIDGRKVFYDIFVPGLRPGTVMLQGGNSVYNLLGFLRKERPDLGTAMDNLAGMIQGKTGEALASSAPAEGVNPAGQQASAVSAAPSEQKPVDPVTCVITPQEQPASAVASRESTVLGQVERIAQRIREGVTPETRQATGAVTEKAPATDSPAPSAQVPTRTEPQAPARAEPAATPQPATSSAQPEKAPAGEPPALGGEQARGEKAENSAMAQL